MRPEDTQEGQAILQEQAWLDSYEGAMDAKPAHMVGARPCPVCQGDHSDPKDKIIADLLAAAERMHLTHGCTLEIVYSGQLTRCADCADLRAAIAAAKVGQ